VALTAVAWLAGLGYAGGPTRPSPEPLHEHLRAILSSRAYQVNPPPLWYVREWLREAVLRVLEAFFSLFSTGPLASVPEYLKWVIIAGCLLALVLIIYHIAITFRILLAGTPRRARGQQVLTHRRARPEDALQAARAAAAQGDFGLAVRRLYEAALLRLDRRGLLTYVPSRTNWENLRGVQSVRLRTDLQPLTRAVDRIVYGKRPATSGMYADCEDHVIALWDAEA